MQVHMLPLFLRENSLRTSCIVLCFILKSLDILSLRNIFRKTQPLDKLPQLFKLGANLKPEEGKFGGGCFIIIVSHG